MDTIVAAFIAAAVALIGAIISFITNRQAVRTEFHKIEAEMARRLTEKLYDKRLETYPLAFEITDSLRGEFLFPAKASPAKASKEYLINVRGQLLDWHKKQGFILSDNTIETYKSLRNALRSVIESDQQLTEETLRPVWIAKNEFRSSMRRDLNLLYIEERSPGS